MKTIKVLKKTLAILSATVILSTSMTSVFAADNASIIEPTQGGVNVNVPYENNVEETTEPTTEKETETTVPKETVKETTVTKPATVEKKETPERNDKKNKAKTAKKDPYLKFTVPNVQLSNESNLTVTYTVDSKDSTAGKFEFTWVGWNWTITKSENHPVDGTTYILNFDAAKQKGATTNKAVFPDFKAPEPKDGKYLYHTPWQQPLGVVEENLDKTRKDKLTGKNWATQDYCERLIFSNNIGNIGSYAFYNYHNGRYINFGNSVQTINDYAFANAGSELSTSKNQTIAYLQPSNVVMQHIGKYAFSGCHYLTSCINTAALDGKDWRSTQYTWSTIQDTKQIGTSSETTTLNLKTFKLPSSVKSIGEEAFGNCERIQEIDWYGEPSDLEIEERAFCNISQLRYVYIPNSLEKIPKLAFYLDVNHSMLDNEGKFYPALLNEVNGMKRTDQTISNNKVSTPGTAGKYLYRLTTAAINVRNGNTEGTKDPTRYNMTNQKMYIAINSTYSQLEEIGTHAFDISCESGATRAVLYNVSTGQEVSSTTKFVFPKLKYIGYRSFMNNFTFTGIIQSNVNIIIKGRAFVNTDLTDLYFKYNGDIDGTIEEQSNIIKENSSIIGSSNIYIQNDSTNHGYSHRPGSNNVPSGYMSLQELIDDSLTNSTSTKSASVTGHWDSKFDALKSVGKIQDNWTTNAPSTLHTASTGKVPKITKGVMNDYKVKKTSVKQDIIRTFLSAKTSWAKKNKADATDDASDAVKAIEEVKFGYTSDKKVDVVIVMDNSPSMDEACSSSEYADAQVYTTIRNAARSINTAAMTYLIAKKICSGSNGNTISIVSFNGNSVNALQDSSKQIGTTGMTKVTNVKDYLFKSEPYTDGGVTNYSAGLSRAYQILTQLKNNTATKDHEKVVLFMSDGKPTGTKSTYNQSQNRVSMETINWSSQENANIVRQSSFTGNSDDIIKQKIAKQNNGILWARAIKGTSTVACPKYNASYVTGITDTKYYPTENSTTENVTGLGVPIYSIMIGADGYGSDLYRDTLNTLGLISSDNEASLTESEITNQINNNKFDKTKVIETREMEKGIEDIVNAVRAVSSEKISIVIPLSSSFRPAYKTNGSSTNRYTFGVNTDASSSAYTKADQDGRQISGESKSTYVEHAKITSASFTENVGNIKYSENRNAFIWTFDAAVGYNMYSVKIPLRYQKGTANIATNSGKKYVAVTSNGISNSLNGNYVDKQNTATRTINYCPPSSESDWSSQTYSMTANTNNGTTSTTSNGNVTNTSGVYAYISDKYADINQKEAEYTNGSTTYEVGNGYLQEVDNSKARILNWAQAQYLPLGDASIKKVKESTTTALAGAQFEIYGAMSDNDEQEQIYRKIKFKNTGNTGKYNYADENETGTVTALSTPSSGTNMGILNIYGLSPGTYYVREIKFPAGYGNIDNITPYTIKVPNGENKETTTVQCYYKFKITGGNKTTQMVNSNKTNEYINEYIPNKETNMTITGIKYDQSKAVMAECIFGLYLSQANAANNTNCLATATSGSDGKFTFTVNQSNIFTNNAASKTIYVKETSGPSNYLLDNRIISATITKKTNAVYDLTSTLAFYNVLGRDISIHVSAPCYSSTYNGSSLSKAGFKFTLTPYYYNKQSNTEVSLANDARFGKITLTTDSTGVATTSGTNTYIYRRVYVAQPSGSTADPLRDVYYKIARTTGASNCKNPLWNEWGTSWSDTNASNTEDRGISLFDNTPNAVVNTNAGQYTSGVAKGEAHRHVYVYLPQLITRYYNYRSNTPTRIQTQIKLNGNAVTIKKSGVGYEQKWDSNSSKNIQQTEVPQYYMALKQGITVNPNITPSSTSALKTDSVAIASGSDTTKHRYYLYNINIYNPLMYDTPVAGGFDNSNQVQTTAIYILLGAIMLITIVSGSILLRRPKSFTYYMK